MICHRHRCIFVHIPRTAGTSIEVALLGTDTWNTKPEEKHIYASTAKKIYSEWWDEYFKFSIVRNPWSRMVSLAKYDWFYGVELLDGLISINQYLEKFPHGEVDNRCIHPPSTHRPITNSVYLNYLDLELDYVGRFEDLSTGGWAHVQQAIGCDVALPHIESSTMSNNQQKYTEYYDDMTREIVANIYKLDIDYFGYEFED